MEAWFCGPFLVSHRAQDLQLGATYAILGGIRILADRMCNLSHSSYADDSLESNVHRAGGTDIIVCSEDPHQPNSFIDLKEANVVLVLRL